MEGGPTDGLPVLLDGVTTPASPSVEVEGVRVGE